MARLPMTRAGVAAIALLWLLFAAAAVGLASPLGQEPASAATQEAASALSPARVLLHVLLTLTAVVLCGRLFAWALQHLGQPPVMGEILAGLALGPSLLGALSPDLMHLLIPSPGADPSGAVSGWLHLIAQTGIILYMFLVGVELNASDLAQRSRAVVAVTMGHMLIPILASLALAAWLYPRFAAPETAYSTFASFIAVAMSVTAFPVLARIIQDRGLQKSGLGALALGSAAVADVLAWCMLAGVIGLAQARSSDLFLVMMSATVFCAMVFVIVRPLIRAWSQRVAQRGVRARDELLALLGLALCAGATHLIGVHAIFGAFLFGSLFPHEGPLAERLRRRLTLPVQYVLLPAFFALAGMITELGILSSAEDWLTCAAIIAIASFSKLAGAAILSRWIGFDWRSAGVLGALMNTRGLMELIVLEAGLSLGIIPPKLFVMMVLMALATTFSTGPLVALLLKGHSSALCRS